MEEVTQALTSGRRAGFEPVLGGRDRRQSTEEAEAGAGTKKRIREAQLPAPGPHLAQGRPHPHPLPRWEERAIEPWPGQSGRWSRVMLHLSSILGCLLPAHSALSLCLLVTGPLAHLFTEAGKRPKLPHSQSS